MSSYYVLEEDMDFEDRVYLGEINLSDEERRAMVIGETRSIASETMVIPLRNKPGDLLPDFLNVKFPLVSAGFKDILDSAVSGWIFYRKAFLVYGPQFYVYYYILPRKLDCLDEKNSQFLQDQLMPGGIRITDGFNVRREQLDNVDIFRMVGLSNRQPIISERLKRLLEEANVQGAVMTETELYKSGNLCYENEAKK